MVAEIEAKNLIHTNNFIIISVSEFEESNYDYQFMGWAGKDLPFLHLLSNKILL